MLGTTVASVNSALTRGRTTLREHRASTPLPNGVKRVPEEFADSFIKRCVAAWQAADIAALADLLKADVVMGAPTLGLRLNGRSTVGEFLSSVPSADERGKFRFIVTRESAARTGGVPPGRDEKAETYRARRLSR
jgi:RNA polymerase sigma-70 factor (ECF subfamily)